MSTLVTFLFRGYKFTQKTEDLTNLERVNSMGESEIEANALSEPDNQPLSHDSLKKIRKIKRQMSR
ncbi:hypothetical protein Xen7305DRAFT_00037650 [Xenococcus sp. PCC 7305]|uniref:hypothetical protein n=1 Tax=Xenococcus sp. PCC 7305 TaxID=102125 RepID=UPI0002ACB5E1|nr:hypothetical protein [Xenococcus sp. PCC 7305]ELS04037.1 hypothetical protein Xen7305DRAFT_00037650 [Xenococcus sp. PCC 7305]